MDLKNKTVLVTGATAGIGLACSEAFAEAGARLILMARREEILQELKSTLHSKHGIEIHSIKCDVRDKEIVDKSLDELPEDFKDIDILINNAGLARGFDKFHEADMDDWLEMIDTNIKGLLYITRKISPWMVSRKSGHIVNIASIAGREVYPKGNVYCATKSAVKALSQSLAIDLNGTGIKVTNIDPGLVETEFARVRFHGDDEKADNVYKGYEPLLGEDIADIVLFAVTRKSHVMIQDILVTPTAQASATLTHKVL